MTNVPIVPLVATNLRLVQSFVTWSDIIRMDDYERQLLIENPLWQEVLQIYCTKISEIGEQRNEEETGVRWAQRISGIPEVESAELCDVHGNLIAFGWLTCQLEDRSNGLGYRVTKQGQSALDWSAQQIVCEPELSEPHTDEHASDVKAVASSEAEDRPEVVDETEAVDKCEAEEDIDAPELMPTAEAA